MSEGDTDQSGVPFPEWMNLPGVDLAAHGIEQEQRGQSPRARRSPLRIEAYAVAAGGDGACELPLFLEMLTFFHPEARVFVLTDADGVAAVEGMKIDLSCIHVEEISTSEQEELANQVRCVDHGDRWSRRWIAVKLEALRRAVEKWQCGVLFCDVDLIFTQRLPPMEWDADVVLSTHQGPCWPSTVPDFHGYFNAGLFLTSRLDVVDRWIELYRAGRGTFYEQQLLEMLPGEFVCDLFPAAWNWGGWRHQEDLSQSGRRPPILHAHIVGKWKDQGKGRIRAVKAQAREQVRRVRESRQIHDRWFFVHCAKAAGSTFSSLIWKEVAEDRHFQYLDAHGLGLQRDWRPAELDLIRTGEMWGQEGSRHIVHNHAQNWPADAVEKMVGDGWRGVALYRPIRERLLSFWFWSQRVIGERGKSYMRPPICDVDDINGFLQMLLDHPIYETEWCLPEFSESIEHWYPATDEGLRQACRDLWRVDVEPARVNTSENPGWQGCIDQGLLYPRTVEKIETDPRVRAWDEWAADRGL